MKAFLVTIFIFITIHLFGQQFKTVNKEEVKDNYERAFLELKEMMEGKTPASFKRAVFITENAFSNDTLD